MNYEIESDESVSEAVVFAVSAVEECDPCSLCPLTDIIDPDALNVLFDPRLDDTPRTGGDLSFDYSNCRVTVYSGDYLTVRPLEGSPRDTRPRTQTGT